MTIYLDNCCFNRPFDDQNHLSVYLETQAKLAVQELIREGHLKLIWSSILDYENSANPDEIIREEIQNWRVLAESIVYSSPEIVSLAAQYKKMGLGNKDALHLSSAVNSSAVVFITVDKGILKKKDMVESIQIINPIDFIRMLEEGDREA